MAEGGDEIRTFHTCVMMKSYFSIKRPREVEATTLQHLTKMYDFEVLDEKVATESLSELSWVKIQTSLGRIKWKRTSNSTVPVNNCYYLSATSQI